MSLYVSDVFSFGVNSRITQHPLCLSLIARQQEQQKQQPKQQPQQQQQ